MTDKEHVEELIKNEELFRMAFELATVGVLLVSCDGKLLHVNKAFSKMLQYPKEELQSKSFEDITHPEDLDKSKECIRALGSGDKDNYRLEKRYITKNGNYIWADVNLTLLRDSNNKPLYFILYVIDITEHKQEDEKLLESERRSHLLFNHMMEGTSYCKMIYDENNRPIDFVYLDVNNNFERLTGLSNVIGKKVSEVIPGVLEQAQDLLQIYSKTASTGIPQRFEIEFKPLNKWFVVSVYMTEINYFVTVFDDITVRKQANEILRESEERFRQMADNIGEVFWLRSKDNKKIVYINKAYEKVWGRSPQSLYENPNTFFDTVYEEDKQMVLTEFEKYNNGGSFDIEYRIVHPNNEVIWVRSRSFPVKDGNGQIIGHTGIAVDITEKKQSIEELVKAKEKADELNNIKSYFLANMSHELRTPMIGILGFSDILLSEVTDESIKDKIQIIYDSSNRLMETLNLILDLSKLEAGKAEMNLKITNVFEVVKVALKVFNTPAQRKNLILQVSGNENINILLDEKMLTQIIHNLVSNAIKYTEKGNIDVVVSRKIINSIETACISVTDTGIGISKEKQEIIFEPFRQESEGINRRFEGTGIGLTITKKLVELLNGKIIVESTPNQGSTFEVRFPFVSRDVKFDPTIQSPKKTNSYVFTKSDKSGVLSVLTVEDDLTARVMYKISLNSFCSLDFSEDAKTAMKMIKKKKYDIILMDIHLAGDMNGLDAMKEIRKIEEYKNTPIIAVTAYAMQSDREVLLSSGFTHYLSKPFTKKMLTDLIKGISRDNLQ